MKNSRSRRRRSPLRIGLLVVALAFVVLVLLVAFTGRVQQPVYDGRPALAWAADLAVAEEAKRARAAAAINAIGPEVVPTLVWGLGRGDSLFSARLTAAESHLPARLWRWLFGVFKPYEATQQRAAAARAFQFVSGDTGPGLGALAHALGDPQPEVVNAAAESLAHLGSDAASAIAAELPKLSKPAQVAALNALGTIGSDAQVALPTIIEMLASTKDSALANLIGSTLHRIGPESIPPLLELLTDSDNTVLLHTRNALLTLAGDDIQAFYRLTAVFPKQPLPIRRQILQVYGEIHAHSRRVALALAEALNDPEPEIRETAATTLRQAYTYDTVAGIVADKTEDLRSRVRAVYADRQTPIQAPAVILTNTTPAAGPPAHP